MDRMKTLAEFATLLSGSIGCVGIALTRNNTDEQQAFVVLLLVVCWVRSLIR